MHNEHIRPPEFDLIETGRLSEQEHPPFPPTATHHTHKGCVPACPEIGHGSATHPPASSSTTAPGRRPRPESPTPILNLSRLLAPFSCFTPSSFPCKCHTRLPARTSPLPCVPIIILCTRVSPHQAPGAAPPNPAFLSKLVVTLFSSPPKSAPGRVLMCPRCPPHGLSLLAARISRISRISQRSPFMPDPKDQPAGRRCPAHLALSARSPSNPASSSCTHVVRARQFHPHQQTTNKHRPFSGPANTPRHFLIACPMSHGCVCCFPSGSPPPCLVPPPALLFPLLTY